MNGQPIGFRSQLIWKIEKLQPRFKKIYSKFYDENA